MTIGGVQREYHLNFIQRIFVAIERPKRWVIFMISAIIIHFTILYSVVGLVISLAMNAAIIIGCIVYVLGSDARFMCVGNRIAIDRLVFIFSSIGMRRNTAMNPRG